MTTDAAHLPDRVLDNANAILSACRMTVPADDAATVFRDDVLRLTKGIVTAYDRWIKAGGKRRPT